MTDAKTAKSEEGEGAKLRMPFALAAVYVTTTPIAALAYAISAWGVYGFAHDVWKLPAVLCFAAALVADLLSLVGALSTYVLRDARFRVRMYTWAVFFGMTALSVGAQESFASHRSVGTAARFASGAIVVALALAVHTLIVVRRNAPPGHPTPVAHPRRTMPTPASPDSRVATPPVVADPPARRKLRDGAKSSDDRQKEYGRRVVEQGERPAVLAAELGVSKRSIEAWAKKYREQHPDPRPVTLLRKADFDTTPDQHVNGAVPYVEVPHGA